MSAGNPFERPGEGSVPRDRPDAAPEDGKWSPCAVFLFLLLCSALGWSGILFLVYLAIG